MGLIGYWGEHHNPAPTKSQRRLLVNAFKKAFKNKPILVRHTNAEFVEAGFGIYYDTFTYRVQAKQYDASGSAKLPAELPPGEYLLAIGIPGSN